MATKYCERHKIWYAHNESCPECGTFADIAGSVIGGAFSATAWAIGKLTEENKASQKFNPDTVQRVTTTKKSAEKEILLLAEKTHNLTLRDIVLKTGFGIDEIESALRRMILNGMATEEINSYGNKSYIIENTTRFYGKKILQKCKSYSSGEKIKTKKINNEFPKLKKCEVFAILENLEQEGYIKGTYFGSKSITNLLNYQMELMFKQGQIEPPDGISIYPKNKLIHNFKLTEKALNV